MNWLKIKWHWAKRKPFFWVGLLLAGITFAVVFFYPAPIVKGERSDLHIRVWSLSLEFIGIWTVWADLRDATNTYGKETFLQSYAVWFKEFFTGRTINLSGANATVQVNSVGASIKLVWPLDSSLPLEERIRRLEANYMDLDRDRDSTSERLSNLTRDLEDRIRKEAQQREQERQVQERNLAKAMAGNAGALGFGILWLTVGVVLATLSQELAKLGV